VLSSSDLLENFEPLGPIVVSKPVKPSRCRRDAPGSPQIPSDRTPSVMNTIGTERVSFSNADIAVRRLPRPRPVACQATRAQSPADPDCRPSSAARVQDCILRTSQPTKPLLEVGEIAVPRIVSSMFRSTPTRRIRSRAASEPRAARPLPRRRKE